MHPTPHPDDADVPQASEIPGLPAEEHLDHARVAEDLAEEPAEKHNATDGYAPADEADEAGDEAH